MITNFKTNVAVPTSTSGNGFLYFILLGVAALALYQFVIKPELEKEKAPPAAEVN